MSKQKDFKFGDYVLFTPESNKERCEIGIVQGVVKNDIHVMFSDGTWPVQKSLLNLFEISAGPWIKGKPKLSGFYNADLMYSSDAMKWFRYFHRAWSTPITEDASAQTIKYLHTIESAINAMEQGTMYRAQSKEYAAWLRARNLSVGEVHEE